MEIYLGNELGNLCEEDCKFIKSIMDNKTYYHFKVSWSNYAGNCQLIAETDYSNKNENPERVKHMFLHDFFSSSASIAKKQRILEEYVKTKMKYSTSLVMFQERYDYTFYFEDVKVIEGLDVNRKIVGMTTDGWQFASIPKDRLPELIMQVAGKHEIFMVPELPSYNAEDKKGKIILLK